MGTGAGIGYRSNGGGGPGPGGSDLPIHYQYWVGTLDVPPAVPNGSIALPFPTLAAAMLVGDALGPGVTVDYFLANEDYTAEGGIDVPNGQVKRLVSMRGGSRVGTCTFAVEGTATRLDLVNVSPTDTVVSGAVGGAATLTAYYDLPGGVSGSSGTVTETLPAGSLVIRATGASWGAISAPRASEITSTGTNYQAIAAAAAVLDARDGSLTGNVAVLQYQCADCLIGAGSEVVVNWTIGAVSAGSVKGFSSCQFNGAGIFTGPVGSFTTDIDSGYSAKLQAWTLGGAATTVFTARGDEGDVLQISAGFPVFAPASAVPGACVKNATRNPGLYACADNDRTVATGQASHAEGTLSRAGEALQSFTIPANGVLVTIVGDVRAYFTNGEGVRATPTVPAALPTVARTVSSVPVFAAGNTTFNLNLAIDATTTAGTISGASGASAHAEGFTTIAEGDASHAEGESTTVLSRRAHVEGYLTANYGYESHAQGTLCKQYGHVGAHVEGYLNETWGPGCHGEGLQNLVTTEAAHVEGRGNRVGNTPRAFTIAAGGVTVTMAGDRTAEFVLATGEVKVNRTTPQQLSAIEGDQATPSVFAAGNTTFNLTAPLDTTTTGGFIVNIELGNNAHAEGNGTAATGNQAHAEGLNTGASGQNAHAEGQFTFATGTNAHSEGGTTTASGANAHAEGNNTTASGPGAHSEGSLSLASGANSHAEGSGQATGGNAHAEGVGTTAQGLGSHAEGHLGLASADYSHTEGESCAASGLRAHAEGQATTASGDYSHAEGHTTVASATRSHAEGGNTLASGQYSHAEGLSCQATGDFAHAEGNASTASKWSHAEGYTCIAGPGLIAHAEGNQTHATADASHSEGQATNATGLGSHAENLNTLASGQASHAEGQSSIASGLNSHCEGGAGTASGTSSHCQGQGCTASGVASHAMGQGSNALREGDFATSNLSFSTLGDNQTRFSQVKGFTPGAVAGEGVLLVPGATAGNFLEASKAYTVTVTLCATVMGLGAAQRQTWNLIRVFGASRRSGGAIDLTAMTDLLSVVTGAGFVGATLVATDGTAGKLALTFNIAGILTVASRVTAKVEYVEVLGT